MSLARKKQSRVWCVSAAYKAFVLDRKIMYLDSSINDVTQLTDALSDDVIFTFEKGDLDYFIEMNNKLLDKNLINKAKSFDKKIMKFSFIYTISPTLYKFLVKIYMQFIKK